MAVRTCKSCIHFDDDPASIEAQIPKFTVFGSAYSSARGVAGFCQKLDRFLDPIPASYCPSFELFEKSGVDNEKERVRPWKRKNPAAL